MENLTEQELVRREKMDNLRKKGIDPFGKRFDRNSNSGIIKNEYEKCSKEELENLKINVKIAGRIMTKRKQGKAGFMHLQDREGQIQVYVRLDHVGEEEFDLFDKADIGDIVGVVGYVFRTNTNELSIKADQFIHLTKALKPLPEKFHGLQDVEETRRRRYIDLIMNDNAKKVALTRPKVIRAIQKFFDNRGFVEVETPILHPILGGANAKPFITHHNTLDMPFYLRIAPELALKKLIVGGLEAVYEIGRLFRNEGISAKHNPEFTTIEAYLAYSDMEGMMDLVEQCLSTVCLEILGTYNLTYNNKEISLAPKFKRWHMVEAIKEITGIDFFQTYTFEEAKELAKKHHVEVPKHFTGVGHIINAFFEQFVEDKIVQPTFIYGHPVEISPLAKKNSEDERFTDRFELFIDSREYANAFSELNDPVDQKNRFLEQLKEKELGNDEANEMDYSFIDALEYGLPPTGGVGIGIDRFIMLLTNSSNIRDIILFPHMKNRN